jgi:hypothetical protein
MNVYKIFTYSNQNGGSTNAHKRQGKLTVVYPYNEILLSKKVELTIDPRNSLNESQKCCAGLKMLNTKGAQENLVRR